MNKTITKINKTKGRFFQKINKIDKTFTTRIKKKGRRLKSIKLQMMEVTTDNAEVQRILGD